MVQAGRTAVDVHRDSLPDVELEGRDQPSQDGPLHAYLASALTGLTPAERDQIFAVSDLVAQVCSDHGIELYEPRKLTDPVHHPSVPDWEVFELDRQRVVLSDLLIYIADRPSTGAGQELIFAQSAVVPILVLARNDTAVSRMVTGMPQSDVIRYGDFDDLAKALSSRLREMTGQLRERRKILAQYAKVEVGRRIREIRERRGMSHEDVVAAIPVPNAFTAGQLARWETSTDLESCLDLLTLRQLGHALRVDPAEFL